MEDHAGVYFEAKVRMEGWCLVVVSVWRCGLLERFDGFAVGLLVGSYPREMF